MPAPDVNTNSKIIDWMVDEYEQLSGDQSHASFTGKSVSKGGSLGRTEATGRGGVIALAELLKNQNITGDISLAVQGYGNVGAFFATIGTNDHKQWKLLSVSDSSGTIHNNNGLDAQELADYKTKGNSFADYKNEQIDHSDSDEIIKQDVDVLVLSALDDAITKANMHTVKAKIIVEMANGPVSAEANRYLSQQGVIILPDIIANAGGVIVSYLEWLQNKQAEHWTEAKVNDELKQYMTKATHNIFILAKQHNISLTQAAYVLALERLTK